MRPYRLFMLLQALLRPFSVEFDPLAEDVSITDYAYVKEVFLGTD